VIRTVLGDLEPARLGLTLAHEHLLMTGGWPVVHEPDFRLDSVDAAVEELAGSRRAGAGAVVEMTPLGFGRSPAGLVEISQRSGMHVVATTGFHKLTYYDDLHWLWRYPVEEVAEQLAAEVTEGMDEHGLEGPVVRRSPARAGVVKLATTYQRAGPGVERLARAIGIVHHRTGVVVATHTEQGTMGHEQLDLLEAAGVPADAVLLGHVDHNPDPGYLADLASRGAYLVFDMVGRIKYGPDSQTIGLIRELAERGLSDRLMLGSDLARRSYWKAYGGGPGLDYLLCRFVPRMRREGLGEVADRILVDNPAWALRLRR
jgi:predicted metal-dependent phosphotriesterase family hydrolase